MAVSNRRSRRTKRQLQEALVTDSLFVIFLVLGATVLAVLGTLLYSYRVWRDDNHPEPSL